MRLLAAAEVDAAGALLGRAFQPDPLLAFMLPDPAERRRLGPAHFTPIVRAMQATGDAWVTDDLSAVACWRLPGAHDFTPAEEAAAGVDRMPELIGAAAAARMDVVIGHLAARRAALAVPDHWYLGLLGVDPDRSGTGLGGAVIAPVLARADEAGEPCYLETLAERNVPFYERHGFRAIEDDVEPVSGLRYWLFLRDPR